MPIKIDQEVAEVLKAATITAETVTITQTLDRNLYVRVNKVLEAAGGKWNRKVGAHVFENDPREALGLAAETGEIADKKKDLGQFMTPKPIAELAVRELVEGAEVSRRKRLLEPSCGRGSLVDALVAEVAPIDLPRIFVGDIDHEMIVYIKGRFDHDKSFGLTTFQNDFLDVTPHGLGHFDFVIMNPPFANGLDVDHVSHALDFLSHGGRIVAIMSAGVKFREDRRHTEFREKVARVLRSGWSFTELPENAFRESGTDVSTVMLVGTRKEGETD